MSRVYNFSAGPAALPEPVLRQAAEEMLDWHGTGTSVMEMSHRGAHFMGIHANAQSLLRELLNIPAHYKTLFMQGGGLGENAIVPMNLLGHNNKADYIDTGEWSRKSIAEARKYGQVRVAASSQASGDTGFMIWMKGSSALFISGDNLRKGAALNAVQIAESLVRLGIVT